MGQVSEQGKVRGEVRAEVQGEAQRSRSADRVGVIGGAGALPAVAFSALERAGRRPVAFGFDGVDGPCAVAPENRLPLGALGRLRERLRACGVTEVLVVGHFASSWLPGAKDPASRPPAPPIAPDAEAVALLAALPRPDGAALMPAVAEWLGAQGFALLAQDEALSTLLAPSGVLGSLEPPQGADAQVELALATLRTKTVERAHALAQSVAIRGDRVVAVEGTEGTDAMIRSAGSGALIVKAARAGQDRRLDLPTVGPETLSAMVAVGAQSLALEAGSVLVVAREEVVRIADRGGIAVFGFPGHGA